MRTYDDILNGMKEKYRALTGADPDKASDIGVRMSVLAGEIFSLQTEVAWLKLQMFPDSAVGEYLDLHAQSRGLSRKQGSKAVGVITFATDNTEGQITIPQGTVCAASGSYPQRFITTAEAVISSGESSVDVAAEAVAVGAGGNVLADTICVIVTSVAGISGVSNQAFSGGRDVETDEQLRARIIDTFSNISNGTNKAFYIKSAMEVNGVTAVGVIPRNRGAGTVDVFIWTDQGSPSQELIDEVYSKLASMREINVDIRVAALTPSYMDIYFNYTCRKGYNIQEVTQRCKDNARQYFSTLAAGETMYVSDMFRYIMQVEGVKNYTFDSDIMVNRTVSDNYIIVPRNFYVTGVQEL